MKLPGLLWFVPVLVAFLVLPVQGQGVTRAVPDPIGSVIAGVQVTVVQKMVPFRSSSTLWVVDRFYDPEKGCEGRLDWYSVILEIEGTATHTGRYRGTETLCFSFNGELQSNRGTLTTANGDLLHFRGSKEDYGSIHTIHEDNTWELAPVYFLGGTGRFVNAEGELFLWGTLSPDRTEGTVTSEGWISTVGSGKRAR